MNRMERAFHNDTMMARAKFGYIGNRPTHPPPPMLLFQLTLYFYTSKESVRWSLSNNEDACGVCRSIYKTIYNALSVKTQDMESMGASFYLCCCLVPLSPPPIFTRLPSHPQKSGPYPPHSFDHNNYRVPPYWRR